MWRLRLTTVFNCRCFVDADSATADPVHPDSRSEMGSVDLLFLYPPVTLVVSSVTVSVCVCRVVPVRVSSIFVPCGILRAPWPSEWFLVRSALEAPRVVLRGFVDLPLFCRGQH